MDFLGGDQDIATITTSDLRSFILALQESPKYRHHPYHKPQETKLSPYTVSTYARAIRAFFGYLKAEELIEHNPMQKVRMPKVPQKVIPTLPEQEVEQLLSQPDRSTDTGFRDFALLLTFLDTGARLSEMSHLKFSDVDLENGYLKVMGKGSKERYLPIGQKVAKALLRYRLRHRPKPKGHNDWFWLTDRGTQLKPRRIEQIVRVYGKRAGIQRCHPHGLRHTSSIMYLRNGGDPFSLQKKLGHSSLQMTRHYCDLADSDVRAAQLRHSPMDHLKI
jgi:site-specific recombinase XerD